MSAMLSSQTKDPVVSAALNRMREVSILLVLGRRHGLEELLASAGRICADGLEGYSSGLFALSAPRL